MIQQFNLVNWTVDDLLRNLRRGKNFSCSSRAACSHLWIPENTSLYKNEQGPQKELAPPRSNMTKAQYESCHGGQVGQEAQI